MINAIIFLLSTVTVAVTASSTGSPIPFPPVSGGQTTRSTTSTSTSTYPPGQGAANDTLPLLPWIVTRLGTGSPSGRPGGFPYAGLYAAITDPNYISLGPTGFREAILPPTSVDCTVKWNTYFEEPYGWVTPCTGNLSSGKWTIEMLRSPNNTTNSSESSWNVPPSPTRNFRVRFRLEESIIVDQGRVVTKIYQGEERFAVGLNLDFVCGGSGVCSSGLKSRDSTTSGEGGDINPDRSVAIRQRLVETRIRCVSGAPGEC